jgi:pimeloyl-ACP methyl ester carboxylesterase
MYIDTPGARIWAHQQGEGDPILFIGGLGDPVEAWQAQIDAFSTDHRVIAHDNRGAGRSPLPPAGVSIEAMADDAAAVLRAHGAGPAHVAGFSMGGAIAQELALRHPELVRSLVLNGTWCAPDEYLRAMVRAWIAGARNATSNRELLEAFFVWVYSARAHADGSVKRYIEETLVSPLAQEADAFFATAQACLDWPGARDRLGAVAVPALVIVGDEDINCAPRLSRELAAELPRAELVVLPGEAHQPFQEVPETWNPIVADFWRRVERSAPVEAAA